MRKGRSLSLSPLYFLGSGIFRFEFMLLFPLGAASAAAAAVVMAVVAAVSAF